MINSFVDGKDLCEAIYKYELEMLCCDIINSLTELIDIALLDAELERKDIECIIFIGNSTKNPFVRETVIDYFDGRINPMH